jgi:hypothetical protein
LLADWDRLQSALDTVIRESVDRDVDMSTRELHRAVLTWIFVDDVRLGEARFAQFGDLPLDYLLQLLLSSNDKVSSILYLRDHVSCIFSIPGSTSSM